MTMQKFRLTGLDEDGVRGESHKLRLVCLIEGDGKLAFFGRVENRSNIDLVLSQGFPCEVACECNVPNEIHRRKYGHTWWVCEQASLAAEAC